MSTSSGLYTLVSIDSPTSLSEASEENLDQLASEPEMAGVRRKWQVFPGRNRFCCDGRVMMAKESGVFYITLILILGTSGLFFGFDCPYLTVNISPAIPIVDGILFVFVMGTLLRTSLSDPGVIPRATPDEAACIEKQIETVQDETGVTATYRPPPRTKEIFIRGQSNQVKYCFTCKIFRPPRASHCSVCDNCVERFDHHCPWVGNCVGLRNYRYFYMFIVSLALHCVFIFACVLTHLVLISQTSDFMTAIKTTPARVVFLDGVVFTVIVAAMCFFSVWSLLGLAGFHSYLVLSNQTTNEDIKGTFASRHGEDIFNPYSYGSIAANYCGLVYGPIQPSLIDRRGVLPSTHLSSSSPNKLEEIEAVNVRHENYGTTNSTSAPVTMQLDNVSQADTPIHVCSVREDAALVEDTVHIVSSFKHYA